jgi:hypothetical protein
LLSIFDDFIKKINLYYSDFLKNKENDFDENVDFKNEFFHFSHLHLLIVVAAGDSAGPLKNQVLPNFLSAF